jgi:hypothetical protein
MGPQTRNSKRSSSRRIYPHVSLLSEPSNKQPRQCLICGSFKRFPRPANPMRLFLKHASNVCKHASSRFDATQSSKRFECCEAFVSAWCCCWSAKWECPGIRARFRGRLETRRRFNCLIPQNGLDAFETAQVMRLSTVMMLKQQKRHHGGDVCIKSMRIFRILSNSAFELFKILFLRDSVATSVSFINMRMVNGRNFRPSKITFCRSQQLPP